MAARHAQAASGAIQGYLGYLGAALEPEELADRLLSLVIAERALEPSQPEVDQPVEFVQVSANTRTLLAPAGQLDTVSKLRGVELHHFAAFYQSSWRAWDWMWGRLDGSGWLVHILLDPRRILAVVEDYYQWEAGTRAGNFAALLRETLGIPSGLDGDCLAADLRFLDQPEAPIPVSLPNSALFLAQAWQDLIAADELPAIAQQMNADAGHALTNGWASEVLTMHEKDKPPAEFAGKLALCPVRGESLAADLRTATFAKLATKAAAVATAAVSSAPEVPGAVRPVLASARTVTRTGYLAAKATGGRAWWMLLLGLVLTVIGGVLATQGMIVVGVTGTALALAGLYLMAMGAWGIHRGLLGALAGLTALALAGSLTLSWVRTKVWGTAQRGSTGLVPAHVLPWLRSSWWGGLALIGGILVLASLISVITRRRPRRNRGAPRGQPPRPPGPPGPSGPGPSEPGTGAVPVPVTRPDAVTAGPPEGRLSAR